MKLIRFRQDGKEKPGLLLGDQLFDTSSFTKDYDEAFFSQGGIDELKILLQKNGQSFNQLPADTPLSSPVARPSKIICIGLNYKAHAQEAKFDMPKEPILFFKSTTALCGPNDDVIIPKGSEKTDWEVELAVVISKKASYVKESEAKDYIAGFSLMNDVSERAFQLERNGTWDKGKGCDTFGPMGPFLLTKDERNDGDQIDLWLKVNGKLMQNSSTADLIFKVPFLISYISQFMTLLPGDIISTGTPAGVGMGMKPEVYLKAGDVMEMGSSVLGTGKQKLKNFV